MSEVSDLGQSLPEALKVCRIIASWAVFTCFRLLVYLLWSAGHDHSSTGPRLSRQGHRFCNSAVIMRLMPLSRPNRPPMPERIQSHTAPTPKVHRALPSFFRWLALWFYLFLWSRYMIRSKVNPSPRCLQRSSSQSPRTAYTSHVRSIRHP